MYYLEELGQNLPSNSMPSSSPKEERSIEGNTMSGIYLYKRLLEYRRIFEQRVRTLFPEFQCGDGDFFLRTARKRR
jgi:hypothetical protein